MGLKKCVFSIKNLLNSTKNLEFYVMIVLEEILITFLFLIILKREEDNND